MKTYYSRHMREVDVVRKAGFSPKNVVAHIYKNAYGYHPLAFNPLYFCLTKHRIVADFVGYIEEILPEKKYKIIFYREPIRVVKDWYNICAPKFPSRRKTTEDPTWLTREGDYVKCINKKWLLDCLGAIEKKNLFLSFEDFLRITTQNKEEFLCNESIKYSGC